MNFGDPINALVFLIVLLVLVFVLFRVLGLAF